MTHNPLMSRERVEIADRVQPTKAQKVRVWNRENGLCVICGKPVPPTGSGVQYDHREMRAVSGDDTDANLFAVHVACHAVKTAEHDAPLIAKVRRQEKLTQARVAKANGFRKHPFLVRGLDGKVRERRK